VKTYLPVLLARQGRETGHPLVVEALDERGTDPRTVLP